MKDLNKLLGDLGLLVALVIFFIGVHFYEKKKTERQKVILFTMYDHHLPSITANFLRSFEEDVECNTNLDVELISIKDREDISKNTFLALKKLSEGSFHFLYGVSYYWMDSIPEATFFGTLPFGMYHETYQKWIKDDSMACHYWKNLYKNHGLNIEPFMCGNTGPQWGGMSSKEIVTTKSFKDLPFRMAGLGQNVIKKFGGDATSAKPDNILTFATRPEHKFIEWIGPAVDTNIIKNWEFPDDTLRLFYYTNAWHDPGTQYEMLINGKFLAELDHDVRKKLMTIMEKYDALILSQYLEKNELVYEKLKQNKGIIMNNHQKPVHILFREFPAKLINACKAGFDEEIEKYNNSSGCHSCKTIYNNYQKFMGQQNQPKDVIRSGKK